MNTGYEPEAATMESGCQELSMNTGYEPEAATMDSPRLPIDPDCISEVSSELVKGMLSEAPGSGMAARVRRAISDPVQAAGRVVRRARRSQSEVARRAAAQARVRGAASRQLAAGPAGRTRPRTSSAAPTAQRYQSL